jgi:hypothetical protein
MPKTAVKRTYAPRKKKRINRSTGVKTLKNKLWELCKRIIRLLYGNTCYTCGRTGLSGSQWHTGHFLPSSTCGIFLRFDLRNLRPQCYYCNINLGGNGAAFYHNLVLYEGQEYVDRLFRDKERITKGDAFFYKNLIDEYTLLIAELDGK